MKSPTQEILQVAGSLLVVLILFQTTNFRLFQTERVCRRKISNYMEMAESSSNG